MKDDLGGVIKVLLGYVQDFQEDVLGGVILLYNRYSFSL